MGRVDLAGSLDSLRADATAEVHGFEWQRMRSPTMTGRLNWVGGKRPRLTAQARADTLRVAQWVLASPAGAVDGFADSLRWSGGTALGGASRFDAAGEWARRGADQLLRIDSLLATLAVRRYRLEKPILVTVSDSAPSVSPTTLRAVDGASVLQVSGRVPGKAPGDLSVQLLGLDLHDLYALLQRDTLGVGGEMELDLHVGGTAAEPTLRGLARLADARFGDFQSPFIEGALNYERRRLDANLDLWRTGANVLQVEAHLPLDLALTGVEQREVDGPLSVRAHTDSVVARPPRGDHAGRDPRRGHAQGRRAGRGDLGQAAARRGGRHPGREHVASGSRHPVRRGARAAPCSTAIRSARAISRPRVAAASCGWTAPSAWRTCRGRS